MFPLLLNMYYVNKNMFNIVLFHGLLIRNYNSSYEQMVAIGQIKSSDRRVNIKIKCISNQFQINFKNKVKFKSKFKLKDINT